MAGDEDSKGLRQQVWGTIGEEFGRSAGEILGTQMDALVITLQRLLKDY